jgi:glucosamine-6-phosphate deaminase
MAPDELQSYRRFMREHLFDHVDIDPADAHVPDGTIGRDESKASAIAYERAIAGRRAGSTSRSSGIGRTGHIGFNEPGSRADSRTRLITLDKVTRMDAASDFFGEWNVPRTAITMGVGTILDAAASAPGLRRAQGQDRPPRRRGRGHEHGLASFLQQHPTPGSSRPRRGRGTHALQDALAAGPVERVRPRVGRRPTGEAGRDLAGPRRSTSPSSSSPTRTTTSTACRNWSPRGAVRTTSTSRSSAPAEDHHRLARRQARPPAGSCPARAWTRLRARVDRVPQARQSSSARTPTTTSSRWAARFIRLCDQGHEVHVAYQTSGNIAVWDERRSATPTSSEEFARAFPALGREVAERMRDASSPSSAASSPARSTRPGAPEDQGAHPPHRGARRREVLGRQGPSASTSWTCPSTRPARSRRSPRRGRHPHHLDLLERSSPTRSTPRGTSPTRTARTASASRPSPPPCTASPTSPWMRTAPCGSTAARGRSGARRDRDGRAPQRPTRSTASAWRSSSTRARRTRALFPGPNDPASSGSGPRTATATAMLYDALGLTEYQAIEGFVTWKPSAADGSLQDALSETQSRPLAHTGAKP